MIHIPSKSTTNVLIPKGSSSFYGEAELVFKSKTRGEIIIDSKILHTTFHWNVEIDTTYIPDGEYEYIVRSGDEIVDRGLAQVGEYKKEIKTEKMTNNKITYNG